MLMLLFALTDICHFLIFQKLIQILLLFDFRDRPNQFRRQYPGSGGPPPGRDFPPR
ncbi:unnamed protein product, partial [Rotaria magnacalcarata]